MREQPVIYVILGAFVLVVCGAIIAYVLDYVLDSEDFPDDEDWGP